MYTAAFVSLIYTVSTIESVFSATTYDKSQSGDLNVQVDLKGLHIIALVKGDKEEYVDYDYAYDYSEMTIKPQNGTTPKPLSSTTSTSFNNSSVTQMVTEDAANTVTLATSTLTPTSEIATSYSPILQNSSETLTDASLQDTASSTSTPLIPAIQTTTSTVCKKGFAFNQKGECELKLQNPSTNALLKLVKLSQRLKLRRERGESAEHEN